MKKQIRKETLDALLSLFGEACPVQDGFCDEDKQEWANSSLK